MKLNKKICASLAAAVLCSVSSFAGEHPEWLKDAFVYHIYPLSYMDSDADGIGDIPGITSRLDYIAQTGFNCIWISPCFSSAFEDGGYDITDFYSIDKRFGTNSDMRELLDKAHNLGIRVCLDLVAGHTSDKHPWFKASASSERNSYSDYFIWTEGKPEPKPEKKFIDNAYPRGGYYLKNFYDIQPALNYGYYQPDPARCWEQDYDAEGPKAVREELKRIIAFWCDMGVDGFRVDMAQSLVKGDDSARHGVRRLWNEIFAWYREAYPENIMLSEWSNPSQSLAAGFDIDLLIHNGVGGKIYRPLVCETDDKLAPTVCYFNQKGEGTLRAPMEQFSEVYREYRKAGGYACMPTCSHDIWRLRRMNRSTEREQKVVLTYFLTLPSPPIVYYGEEIAMRNIEYAPAREGSFSSRNRSTCRTPMQWTSGANAGFSEVKKASSLYLPVDYTYGFPNVEQQLSDPGSVLAYVKGLIALRKSTPALGADACWEYSGDVDQPYPMIFSRFVDGERYIIVLNPSASEASGRFMGSWQDGAVASASSNSDSGSMAAGAGASESSASCTSVSCTSVSGIKVSGANASDIKTSGAGASGNSASASGFSASGTSAYTTSASGSSSASVTPASETPSSRMKLQYVYGTGPKDVTYRSGSFRASAVSAAIFRVVK